MRFVKSLVLTCSLMTTLLCSRASSQKDSSDALHESLIVKDARTAWDNGVQILTAPLHFNHREWIETGAYVGGTVLFFAVDNSARPIALRNRSHWGDNMSSVGTDYGNAVYAISLAGGLYGGGWILQNNDVRETGLMLFESLAFSGIATNVLKSIAGRSRPFLEEGPFRYNGFQFKEETTSLPSGHSTVAFAMSSVLSSQLNNTWATISLYSLATLTAASRVYNDEHWVSDTFLGAVIGDVIGKAVVRLHQPRDGRAEIRISPSLDGLKAELIF